MARVRSWRCLLPVLLFVLLQAIMGATAWAADVPAVLGVRAAAHDGITRFVLDLSAKVPFSVGVTGDNQILLDMAELDWRAPSASLSRPVGLLTDFRFEKPRAGASRLVLQTKGQVEKAFIIPPGEVSHYRLVVDLGPAPPPPSHAAPAPVAEKARPAKPMAGGAVPVALPLSPAPQKPAVKPPNTIPVVVLDPGHGGVDPGATSVSGIYEKNIVLTLARDVRDVLDKGGKVKCLLTRDRDVFIPLKERVAIARSGKADLFISLHADTVDDPSIRGLSVYTLSQTASDAEAQALADKENKADIVAGLDLSNELPEVTNILIDLVQRESMNLSARFAGRVIREVDRDTHNVLGSNTHRFAGFAVLKAPDVPSVLVEAGYLSNSQDEQMLRRSDYRAKLATALARAIEGYFADGRKGHRT